MRQVGHILVLCDGSPAEGRAVDRAGWLAASSEARVTLMTAEPETEPETAGGPPQPVPGGALRASGIVVAQRPLPPGGIAGVAAGHDLVVKGALPAPAEGGLAEGDVALALASAVPVWVLRGRTGPDLARILAVVTPGPGASVRDRSSRSVLDAATSLASASGGTVIAVHAWHLPEEAALRRTLAKLPTGEVEDIVAGEERQSRWRLDALVADHGASGAEIEVRHLKGTAPEVIPPLVAGEGIDTLVLGVLPGPSGSAMAGALMRRAACSVLAVPVPPGTADEESL